MAWTSTGVSLKGDQGEQGPQGPQGIQGNQGVQGPPGEDGAGVAIAGQVDTYEDLPTGLGTEDAGDGYLVDADGLLYVWSGTAFPTEGNGVEFRGPQGPAGATGPQGDEGPQGPQGIQGNPGTTGATGATGARGAGWRSGSGAPSVIAGDQAGDHYLDLADGQVYVNS